MCHKKAIFSVVCFSHLHNSQEQARYTGGILTPGVTCHVQKDLAKVDPKPSQIPSSRHHWNFDHELFYFHSFTERKRHFEEEKHHLFTLEMRMEETMTRRGGHAPVRNKAGRMLALAGLMRN